MSFSQEVREELLELKMWDNNSSLSQDEQLARLVIREAFIKEGFINDPNKDYHLEILFKTKNKALEVKEIINNFGIDIKLTKKAQKYMLYLKEGEEISSFLALMGATKSMLKFEEIRVIKETRNNINRLVNCETANLNKTINAAVKQIEDIKKLKKYKKFDELPDNLKELAELRIKNPDMSYEELGKNLTKPIGKSGVSHRLEKISKIANNII
ncbi:MAG: DNA-binding protein WhiA [Clostridia bacterium]|nr:DNA-binding protein WhiA [Clostridia bacterium]